MQQWGGTAVSATAPIAQTFDTPEPYALGLPNPGTASGPLASASARYTPLVWPTPAQKISHQQRVKGNYPLDMTFNANQTGQFSIYTLEEKQYSIAKCSEMLAAMGIDPTSVQLVPKLGMKNVKVGAVASTGQTVVVGKVDSKKTFCFPRGVVTAASTASAASS